MGRANFLMCVRGGVISRATPFLRMTPDSEHQDTLVFVFAPMEDIHRNTAVTPWKPHAMPVSRVYQCDASAGPTRTTRIVVVSATTSRKSLNAVTPWKPHAMLANKDCQFDASAEPTRTTRIMVVSTTTSRKSLNAATLWKPHAMPANKGCQFDASAEPIHTTHITDANATSDPSANGFPTVHACHQ